MLRRALGRLISSEPDSTLATLPKLTCGEAIAAGVALACAVGGGVLLARDMSVGARHPRPRLPPRWRFIATDAHASELLVRLMSFAHAEPEAYCDLGEACDAMAALWIALHDPSVQHRHSWSIYAYRYLLHAQEKITVLAKAIKRARQDGETDTTSARSAAAESTRPITSVGQDDVGATDREDAQRISNAEPQLGEGQVRRRERIMSELASIMFSPADDAAASIGDDDVLLGSSVFHSNAILGRRLHGCRLPRNLDFAQFRVFATALFKALEAYHSSIFDTLASRPFTAHAFPTSPPLPPLYGGARRETDLYMSDARHDVDKRRRQTKQRPSRTRDKTERRAFRHDGDARYANRAIAGFTHANNPRERARRATGGERNTTQQRRGQNHQCHEKCSDCEHSYRQSDDLADDGVAFYADDRVCSHERDNNERADDGCSGWRGDTESHDPWADGYGGDRRSGAADGVMSARDMAHAHDKYNRRERVPMAGDELASDDRFVLPLDHVTPLASHNI